MGYDNPHLRHALEPWGAEAPAARIAVLLRKRPTPAERSLIA
jgi:hypothetical protein